jgi:glutamate-1-semialdehyde 2,1-aminomutase
MKREISNTHFQEAKTFFPGGVNSPVRAFGSVAGSPLFMVKGKGSQIQDADGNWFIDYCCSWGPLIAGHAHPKVQEAIIGAVENGTSFGTPTVQENDLARLILDNHRFIEKIRFVSSGTEAVMSAIRLARGYTKRDKIVKFEGCYHGHADALLVKAGSGLATLGTSSSLGVPESYAAQTLVLPLNDIAKLEALFESEAKAIAAVIIEPMPANNGLLLQDLSFLKRLRELCTEHGVVLIFDEVISGFRVGFEGASGVYNIAPDLITLGKIIGGGLPVGAYGGKKEIMACIAPEGGVYQAGTLSGNPVAMSAGYAQLSLCLAENFYTDLRAKTKYLAEGIQKYSIENNLPFSVQWVCGIFWLVFDKNPQVQNTAQIHEKSSEYFKILYNYLLEEGIYLGPSAYEVGFVSAVHSYADLDKTIVAFHKSLQKLYNI